MRSALGQARKDALGTRYLTTSIARFIPSVTIFLSLLFQNSSRVSGTVQCYWTSLIQVRITNESYSHFVCIMFEFSWYKLLLNLLATVLSDFSKFIWNSRFVLRNICAPFLLGIICTFHRYMFYSIICAVTSFLSLSSLMNI